MPVWTRLSLLAVAGALAFAFGTAPAHAQAKDPMVGTWKFNPAGSKSSTALPRKRDIVITQKGEDITVVVDEVAADGAAAKWSFTTRRDGKPVPVTGWAMSDTAISSIKGRTGKTVYTKGGKTVMESNTEVSADGKTLVIKGYRMSPDGKQVPYESHYDRVG